MRQLSQDVAVKLRDGRETLPAYAGQMLPIAFVSLEFENRRPVRILQFNGARYKFDERGSIHDHILERIRDLRDASRLDGLDDPAAGQQVVSIERRLAKKRAESRRWKPNTGQINRMINAIWNS